MSREYKKITKEELKNVLEAHKLWIADPEKGEKANLSGVNLFKVKLKGVNLKEANLLGVKLKQADLTAANLQGADLRGANLFGANLFDANLQGANLRGANLDVAIYNPNDLKFVKDVNPKYLGDFKEDIILNSESRISTLEKQLQEKEAVLEALKAKDKDGDVYLKLEEEYKAFKKSSTKDIEALNSKIDQEREAKQKTEKQINEAVSELQKPNNYIKNQIRTQTVLSTMYLFVLIITVLFLISYIGNQYLSFKEALNPETTFVNLLFYVSPIAFCFSLIVIFINQINKRIATIIALNEKRRRVETIEGNLKAIHTLSLNNDESRNKIMDVMDKIINNTLSASEELSTPITLEDDDIKNPIEKLKNIKDLLS